KNKYNSIEIEINDYHQLSPIKSVAMLILMGDEENLESRCSKCPRNALDSFKSKICLVYDNCNNFLVILC
ncbi:hypothetical protein BM531_23755, partial [Clostridioides difficile]